MFVRSWPIVLAMALGVAVVLVVWLVEPLTVRAREREPVDFSVRIAARLTDDGRIEFGLQQLDVDGEPLALLLADARFVPADLAHHRWLNGTEVICSSQGYAEPDEQSQGQINDLHQVKVQIQARLHPTRNQIEFGLVHQIAYVSGMEDDFSELLVPRQRFFPSGITHQRWLYSSRIEFTVTFGDETLMSADSTMENETGETDADRYVPETHATEEENDDAWTTTIPGCDLEVEDVRLISDECIVRLIEFCRMYDDFPECGILERLDPDRLAQLQGHVP